MASKTIEFLAPTGLTLTLELYPLGSDTIANTGGDSATEQTNRKGLYLATVAEAIDGLHTAHVKLSGAVIAVGYVNVIDVSDTYRVSDFAAEAQEIEDAISTVGPLAESGFALLDSESGDKNLTSHVAVLTHTPSTTAAKKVSIAIVLGDTATVAKQLDGTAQMDVEIKITIGGIALQPWPRYFTVESGVKRIQLPEIILAVPANRQVIVTAKSGDADDDDVTCSAFMYELQAGVIDSGLMIETTIATLTSQTVFTLSEGSGDNDAYADQLVMLVDQSDSEQKSSNIVDGYVGVSKQVTLTASPKFTIAVGDIVRIIAASSVASGSGGSGGTGDGDIAVNHDYGGADSYQVLTPDDDPVDNAKIEVFLATDADFSDVVARTYTGSDGRWIAPLMLDADDYKIVVSKPGTIEEQVTDLTVT